MSYLHPRDRDNDRLTDIQHNLISVEMYLTLHIKI